MRAGGQETTNGLMPNHLQPTKHSTNLAMDLHKKKVPQLALGGFGSTGGPDEAQTSRQAASQAKAPAEALGPVAARIVPQTARPSMAPSPSPVEREEGEVRWPPPDLSLPMTPAVCLTRFNGKLSAFEESEILEYPKIWFAGIGAKKIQGTPLCGQLNHGYDDERGDYLSMMRDHLGYRYEVLCMLGKGSFGEVMKCIDHRDGTLRAVKIIRNKKRFHQQALVEVNILQYLKEKDPDNQQYVVHLHEYFYFRNHLCIAFDLCSINLYEFLKSRNFQGLSLGLIRRFAVQMLVCLRFLRRLHIIHCDLKPENVLLKYPDKSLIKVIDFGSSCFDTEQVYTYIQSRFYRSPEVILGLPYEMKIDMWSFGCILSELLTGYPLFPGENEVEQLACIMEIQGKPPMHLVEAASRKKMFFDADDNPRIVANSRGKKRRPGSKDLASVLRCPDPSFVSFLEGCLRWDPLERFSADDALQHEFITQDAAVVQASIISRPISHEAGRQLKPSMISSTKDGSSKYGSGTAHPTDRHSLDSKPPPAQPQPPAQSQHAPQPPQSQPPPQDKYSQKDADRHAQGQKEQPKDEEAKEHAQPVPPSTQHHALGSPSTMENHVSPPYNTSHTPPDGGQHLPPVKPNMGASLAIAVEPSEGLPPIDSPASGSSSLGGGLFRGLRARRAAAGKQ
eukprot:jgi/Mesvir1/4947/Mv04570-RA.2